MGCVATEIADLEQIFAQNIKLAKNGKERMSMTENEAIERLKCMRLFMEINDKQNESKFLEDDYIANKTAIQALEEIQQYRAIGTVERLNTLQQDYWKLNEMCKEYSAIGTIDEFKALKEKNTPKKRCIWKSGHTCCPNCERGVLTEDRFCSYCGQALKQKET